MGQACLHPCTGYAKNRDPNFSPVTVFLGVIYILHIKKTVDIFQKTTKFSKRVPKTFLCMLFARSKKPINNHSYSFVNGKIC